jgi:hypothetical protein
MLGVPGLLNIMGVPALSRTFFYYLWRWENWRAITGMKAQRYVSDQVGKRELVDLLKVKRRQISSPEEWIAKRGEIKHLLLQVMCSMF